MEIISPVSSSQIVQIYWHNQQRQQHDNLMRQPPPLHPQLRTGLTAALAMAASLLIVSPDPTVGAATGTNAPAIETPRVKKQLTGAELYSIHCNRCHPERYPTERTAAQWKTIMLHMQIRANLPGKQARLILKYLQENSGR